MLEIWSILNNLWAEFWLTVMSKTTIFHSTLKIFICFELIKSSRHLKKNRDYRKEGKKIPQTWSAYLARDFYTPHFFLLPTHSRTLLTHNNNKTNKNKYNREQSEQSVVDLIIELNDVKPKYERERERGLCWTHFLLCFKKNKIDNINHDVGVKFIDGKEKNEAFWV